jgi:argininosuccinate lyase
VSEQVEHTRRLYGGREIDPVEAASIHIHLEELRDHDDSYLEIEVDAEDSAERIESDCRAVAMELGLRLHFTVMATRHVLDAAGRPASRPSLLQVTLDRDAS